MNSKIIGWGLGIIWLMFWIIQASVAIGEKVILESFPWYLPLEIAAVIIPSFLFGFLASKKW